MMDRVLKHGVGYDLIVIKTTTRRDGQLILGIRCQTCQKVSFHPQDVEQRYCSKCKVFHEESLLSHEA